SSSVNPARSSRALAKLSARLYVHKMTLSFIGGGIDLGTNKCRSDEHQNLDRIQLAHFKPNRSAEARILSKPSGKLSVMLIIPILPVAHLPYVTRRGDNEIAPPYVFESSWPLDRPNLVPPQPKHVWRRRTLLQPRVLDLGAVERSATPQI